jgi:uncharacterized protein with PIN domain
MDIIARVLQESRGEEAMSRCYFCNRKVTEDDSVLVGIESPKPLCINCFDDYFYRCKGCGEIIRREGNVVVIHLGINRIEKPHECE